MVVIWQETVIVLWQAIMIVLVDCFLFFVFFVWSCHRQCVPGNYDFRLLGCHVLGYIYCYVTVIYMFFRMIVMWHWGGWNSSVGSAWARCPQRRGFDPPLGTFSVEGIFPLELTWAETPFPQNSFGWEYKPRSSLCIHAFHRTDSKDPDIHVLDGWMPATKTHPARTIHEDGMWLP